MRNLPLVFSILLVGSFSKPASADAAGRLAEILNTGLWSQQDVREAKKLIRHGVSITTHSPRGVTVLMMAAKAGDVATMRAALRGGVDVNSRTTDGWTALDYVMCSRSEEKVRLLLENGADANARDEQGKTPLMLATHFKFRRGIELLLAHGARINDRNEKGRTALDYTDNHPGIDRLLRQHGAKD